MRIGGGESDPITGLLAWTDYNMLVFKKNSFTWSTLIRRRTRTLTIRRCW